MYNSVHIGKICSNCLTLTGTMRRQIYFSFPFKATSGDKYQLIHMKRKLRDADAGFNSDYFGSDYFNCGLDRLWSFITDNAFTPSSQRIVRISNQRSMMIWTEHTFWDNMGQLQAYQIRLQSASSSCSEQCPYMVLHWHICRHDIVIAFTLPSIVVTPELLNKNCSYKPSAIPCFIRRHWRTRQVDKTQWSG